MRVHRTDNRAQSQAVGVSSADSCLNHTVFIEGLVQDFLEFFYMRLSPLLYVL